MVPHIIFVSNLIRIFPRLMICRARCCILQGTYLRIHRKGKIQFLAMFPFLYVYPVVALNSALRFTPLEIMPRSVSSPAIAGLEFLTGFIKPLPREGWLSNQCRHLDQSKSDLWKLSSLRAMRPSLRGRSPSLRAGGLSEPEAGAEPGPAAKR